LKSSTQLAPLLKQPILVSVPFDLKFAATSAKDPWTSFLGTILEFLEA
jgi:hypothetical protein